LYLIQTTTLFQRNIIIISTDTTTVMYVAHAQIYHLWVCAITKLVLPHEGPTYYQMHHPHSTYIVRNHLLKKPICYNKRSQNDYQKLFKWSYLTKKSCVN